MNRAELYKFTYLNSTYTYTSRDEVIFYKGEYYQPEPLTRGRIEQTVDAAKSDLSLKTGIAFPLLELYRQGGTVVPVELELIVIDLDEHNLDPNASQGDLIFKGHVSNPKWKTHYATLTITHHLSALSKNGLRYRYSIECNHEQFDEHCKLIPDAWAKSYTVVAVDISGYLITVDEEDGKSVSDFVGGLVLTDAHQGTISSAPDGNMIKVFRPVPGLKVGDHIRLVPSCQRHWMICRDFFNNLANCSAFVDVPNQNPFGREGIK